MEAVRNLGGCDSASGTAMPPAIHVAHMARTYCSPGGAMIAYRGPFPGPALSHVPAQPKPLGLSIVPYSRYCTGWTFVLPGGTLLRLSCPSCQEQCECEPLCVSASCAHVCVRARVLCALYLVVPPNPSPSPKLLFMSSSSLFSQRYSYKCSCQPGNTMPCNTGFVGCSASMKPWDR